MKFDAELKIIALQKSMREGRIENPDLLKLLVLQRMEFVETRIQNDELDFFNMQEEVDDFINGLEACLAKHGEEQAKLYINQELPILAKTFGLAAENKKPTSIYEDFNDGAPGHYKVKYSFTSYLLYQLLRIDALSSMTEVKTILEKVQKHSRQLPSLSTTALHGQVDEKGVYTKDQEAKFDLNVEQHAKGLKRLADLRKGIEEHAESNEIRWAFFSSDVWAETEAELECKVEVMMDKKRAHRRHMAEVGNKTAFVTGEIREIKTLDEVAKAFTQAKTNHEVHKGTKWADVIDALKSRMMELISESKNKGEVITAIMQGKAVGACGFDNQTAKSLRQLANYHDRWLSYLVSPLKCTACWNTLSECSKMDDESGVDSQLQTYVKFHRK